MTVKELRDLLYSLENEAEVFTLSEDDAIKDCKPIQGIVSCKGMADTTERVMLLFRNEEKTGKGYTENDNTRED